MDLTMIFVWLGAGIVCTIVELETVQLVSVWFVVGSLAALISAICGAPVWLQIVIFLAVTVLSLVLTRPMVRKLLRSKKEKTNTDRFIGMEAIVTSEINNTQAVGLAKVAGTIWSARNAENDDIIPVCSLVKIENIQGVKLMVSLVKTPAGIHE